MAESVKEIAEKKIGPFDLWVWILIGAGGLLAISWWKNRTGSSNAATTTGSSSTMTSDSEIPQFVNQTYVSGSPPTSPNIPTATGPTAAQYQHEVASVSDLKSLIHRMVGTRTKNESTISKDTSTIKSLQSQLSAAKKPVTTVRPSSHTPAKRTSHGESYTTYTVKPGDSLWSIAQHAYGSGSDAETEQEWKRIYAWNKAKIGSNPNLIHPGTVLSIPAK